MKETAKPWGLYDDRRRTLFLVILFLVAALNNLDKTVITVVLEPIKREFGVSDTALGVLSGLSFALLYATLGIPVALAADRGNRKTIIGISLVIWSAMTMLCGLAQSFVQLVVARVGVGAGEAGGDEPAQSLNAD
jgi:predicted MFS family arabinose efflux permease